MELVNKVQFICGCNQDMERLVYEPMYRQQVSTPQIQRYCQAVRVERVGAHLNKI